MKTEVLLPVIPVRFTEDQITTIRMLLLEEKLAAQGHVPLRDKGTLLDEVEDILATMNTELGKWREAYAT